MWGGAGPTTFKESPAEETKISTPHCLQDVASAAALSLRPHNGCPWCQRRAILPLDGPSAPLPGGFRGRQACCKPAVKNPLRPPPQHAVCASPGPVRPHNFAEGVGTEGNPPFTARASLPSAAAGGAQCGEHPSSLGAGKSGKIFWPFLKIPTGLMTPG